MEKRWEDTVNLPDDEFAAEIVGVAGELIPELLAEVKRLEAENAALRVNDFELRDSVVSLRGLADALSRVLDTAHQIEQQARVELGKALLENAALQSDAELGRLVRKVMPIEQVPDEFSAIGIFYLAEKEKKGLSAETLQALMGDPY